MAKTTTQKISRDDLERSFLALQDGVNAKVEDKRSTVATVVGAVGVVLVIVVFLLGRRSGKRKTTYVEIRRV
jgi:hypothetical protein